MKRRRVGFECVDRRSQRNAGREYKKEMDVIRHTSRSQKGHLMLARNRSDEGVEPLLEFLWDEIFPALGAVNHMHIIVGVRMTHGRGSRAE